MKFRFTFFILLISSLFLSACGQKEIKDEVDWPIKNFSATTQSNKTFDLKSVKGKVWISDFIFTSCADVCPPMTSNMAKLQKKVKDEGLKNVDFVSFSIDPKVDTPAALSRFAKQFQADFNNWTFLTGYSQAFIENFALKNFKEFVKKPAEGSQVIHQTFIFLVDQNGHVRKSYDGYQNVPYDEIIQDIKALQ
ncbi:SCO family protein [Neobacillus endophyticus]|uniref:SCO family protein n=1 Tax=Neobacillus endophyticus TaxID=2738405 RepID=UPI0028AD6506|nr:SCO family protein [Neobacillus endophyticus]